MPYFIVFIFEIRFNNIPSVHKWWPNRWKPKQWRCIELVSMLKNVINSVSSLSANYSFMNNILRTGFDLRLEFCQCTCQSRNANVLTSSSGSVCFCFGRNSNVYWIHRTGFSSREPQALKCEQHSMHICLKTINELLSFKTKIEWNQNNCVRPFLAMFPSPVEDDRKCR